MSLLWWLRRARGPAFCVLSLASILSGWLLLCCPLLPLLALRPRAYRAAIDTVFAMWELYPAALVRFLLGARIVVTGDAVCGAERSLLVMNHRTRLDWNFLWAGLQCAAPHQSTRLKFVLKAPIAHAPGPGWVMQMACHLYIHRNWSRDQQLLAECLSFFSDMDHTCQILLFPEGTDLTTKTCARSDRYAESRGLPHYEYVLHPKTTGFAFLVDTMRQQSQRQGHTYYLNRAENRNPSQTIGSNRAFSIADKQLDTLYDVSVGYPKTLVQNEVDLLKGWIPEEIHFHFKRYDVTELPASETDVRLWLERRWQEKEDQLRQFYKDGQFKGPKIQTDWRGRGPAETALCLALCFWTSLSLLAGWLLLYSLIAQVYALLNVIIFVTFSVTGTGAQHLEIKLHQKRKSTLCQKR